MVHLGEGDLSARNASAFEPSEESIRGHITIEYPRRIVPLPDIRQMLGEEGKWRKLSLFSSDQTTDPLQVQVVDALRQSFERQGHKIVVASPSGLADIADGTQIDIITKPLVIPDGEAPLLGRIPEEEAVGSLHEVANFVRVYGVRKQPGHLVGIATTIRERLSELPHQEVVYAFRRLMLRQAAPTVVFLSRATDGSIAEMTLATPEGGSISIPCNRFDLAIDELRDSLVTLALASDVSKDDDRIGRLSLEEWRSSRSPEMLKRIGVRMDSLGMLPDIIRVEDHVTDPHWKKILNRWLGTLKYSEGAMVVVDPVGSLIPQLGTIYCTASGQGGNDKRSMTDADIVPIAGRRGETLLVYPPNDPNIVTRVASVEAREFIDLVLGAPKIRLRRTNDGLYIPDSCGEIETSVIAGIGHAHIKPLSYNPRVVEYIPQDTNRCIYGSGCGTDLLADYSRYQMGRSEAMSNPNDPRSIVLWPVNRHGVVWLALWRNPVDARDGRRVQGLEASLEMMDPARGSCALGYDPYDIPQYPVGEWPNG